MEDLLKQLADHYGATHIYIQTEGASVSTAISEDGFQVELQTLFERDRVPEDASL